MTTHVVKANPEWFPHYFDGTKPFSIRVNDRDYQDGDLFHVREWGGALVDDSTHLDNGYTGREGLCRIVKVWHGLHPNAGVVHLTLEVIESPEVVEDSHHERKTKPPTKTEAD